MARWIHLPNGEVLNIDLFAAVRQYCITSGSETEWVVRALTVRGAVRDDSDDYVEIFRGEEAECDRFFDALKKKIELAHFD